MEMPFQGLRRRFNRNDDAGFGFTMQCSVNIFPVFQSGNFNQHVDCGWRFLLYKTFLCWAFFYTKVKWNKLTVSKYNFVRMYDNTKCPLISLCLSRFLSSSVNMIFLFDWTNNKSRNRKNERESEWGNLVSNRKNRNSFIGNFSIMDSHKCIISRIKLQIQVCFCAL